MIVRLAIKSLLNRRLTAALAALSIAFSVVLFLGVEKVRLGARSSFANTISGTDLIVGARSGAIQLLLYTVFRIGNATNNVTWASYQDLAKRPEVDWIVPISLGDSHRGFRVLGTTPDYFKRYRYRQTHGLVFASGQPFADLFDTVLGSEVAAALGYKLGDKVVIAHGLGSVSFVEHDDKPFRVAGILQPTGTPVDRTIHVSLAAIEAIHVDWQSGARVPGETVSADEVRALPLEPKAVTAALIGLKSRLATFRFQRAINEYREEPLSAIIPGAALQELWALVGVAETALAAVSTMIVVTALLGMMTMILTTLNERRREMAIFRSVGAGPGAIIGLLAAEAGLLTAAGVAIGAAALYVIMAVAQPAIEQLYGLQIVVEGPSLAEAQTLAAIVLAGFIVGLVPAVRAYRQSLADGMSIVT